MTTTVAEVEEAAGGDAGRTLRRLGRAQGLGDRVCAGACRPRRAPRRDPQVHHDHRGAGAVGPVAGQLGGDPGGDGVDRVLLEAGLAAARGPGRVLAAECGAHMRNVPGRKTDVADAAWICQLVEHGLVRPSFVPPQPIRELRDLTRYRKTQIEDRAREVQRLDKVLQDAGIKLTSVASETLGVSARLMLEALVAGTHDPDVLAELAKGKLRAKLPELREALHGRFRGEHHGLLVAQILAHIDYLDETIAFLSERIEQLIAPFSRERELLETIPGIGRTAAQVLIAEVGVDMSVFPTSAHLASWAGQCPGNRESAGKRRSGRPRHGSKWLRTTLTESAKAASRCKGSYLSAQYTRLRGRRGPGKATGALSHSILVAAYHILDQ